MNQTVSLELSVSFVSWINDQLRDRIEVSQQSVRTERRRQTRISGFIITGVTCISVALLSLITG